MLCYAGRRGALWAPRQRLSPALTRRACVQLDLNFLDVPVPENRVWERLCDEQKAVAVETVTRILTKAALAENPKEENHE